MSIFLTLSRPILLSAIVPGGIEAFNLQLRADAAWQQELQSVNDAHRNLRRHLMTAEEIASLPGDFGPDGASSFMAAGLAGMSPSKLDDVKCLHAQLADYLIRGDNAIGEEVVAALDRRGVSLGGCADCSQQCDWHTPQTEDTWNYRPQKNKVPSRPILPANLALCLCRVLLYLALPASPA